MRKIDRPGSWQTILADVEKLYLPPSASGVEKPDDQDADPKLRRPGNVPADEWMARIPAPSSAHERGLTEDEQRIFQEVVGHYSHSYAMYGAHCGRRSWTARGREVATCRKQ